jgi:hypothetical protein
MPQHNLHLQKLKKEPFRRKRDKMSEWLLSSGLTREEKISCLEHYKPPTLRQPYKILKKCIFFHFFSLWLILSTSPAK